MEYFVSWLENHGWPPVEDIEFDDLMHAIDCYARYEAAWEPELDFAS